MNHPDSHINKALTMPRATAGNMGAMAITAGTVVVVVTPPVVTPPVVTPPVVTPPVVTPPVVAPPVTVCRRWGRKGREGRGGRGGRGGRLRGVGEAKLRLREARSMTE